MDGWPEHETPPSGGGWVVDAAGHGEPRGSVVAFDPFDGAQDDPSTGLRIKEVRARGLYGMCLGWSREIFEIF